MVRSKNSHFASLLVGLSHTLNNIIGYEGPENCIRWVLESLIFRFWLGAAFLEPSLLASGVELKGSAKRASIPLDFSSSSSNSNHNFEHTIQFIPSPSSNPRYHLPPFEHPKRLDSRLLCSQIFKPLFRGQPCCPR